MAYLMKQVQTNAVQCFLVQHRICIRRSYLGKSIFVIGFIKNLELFFDQFSPKIIQNCGNMKFRFMNIFEQKIINS